jgi:hypothetical protein
MDKRKRFILQSVILSLGLFAIQTIGINWRYLAIGGLEILAYFGTAWSLHEEIVKVSWLTAFPLPAFYTAAVSLFYFLLPSGVLTQLVIIILFGIGMYALLLTENIFLVAANRTIQLLRAAQAVGFLITLLTGFFIFNTVFSFKLAAWFNGGLIFLITPFLVLPSLWSVSLKKRLEKRIVNYTLVISLLLGQLSFLISCWPLTITTTSLVLVSYLYVVLGIVQNSLMGRLFKDVLKEYIRVAVIIILITFFLARWRG